MKKFTFLICLALMSVPTFAKTVTCLDKNIQDAQFVATFKGVGTEKVLLSLAVPVGEVETVKVKGLCQQQEDAEDLYLSCSATSLSGEKYWAVLKNENGKLSATANQVGFNPILLPDCN